MSFILAIHLPIIGLAFFPALFPTLPILLFPLHIVFLELIIDPICSIAFETEKEELGIMNRPPRSPQESFFGASKIIQSVIQGLLLLGITVFVYFLSLKEGHTEGEIRAIAFSTLILGNIFLILSKLSKTRSFVGVLLEGNWAALSILGFAFIALVALIRVPFLEKLFGFQNPGWAHFGPTLLASGAMLALLEGAKFLKNRKSGA